MTLGERKAMGDRERIKQYIESSIRRGCDDITDSGIKSAEIMTALHDEMLKLSKIYKNMGLDKEGDKE